MKTNNHNHNHTHSHNHSCGCSCGCGHEHNEHEKLTVIRIAIGALLFAAGILAEFLSPTPYLDDVLFLISYIILGIDIVFNAVRNVLIGKLFNENFLMSIASIGAFVIGEHPEAVGVMLFYRVGEALQERAEEKSRNSISELMDLRPDYAVKEIDGNMIKFPPTDISIGDTIIISPGEKIPLDGTVISGESYIDTKALTGENVPRKVTVGSNVLSGSINTTSPIYVRVTKTFSESTASKILDMVENAQSKKAKSEKFISVFAKYYTPVVVLLAVLVMIVPSALTGELKTWIYRGLMFLVVSCPCALVVSIPLTFFAGIGCASKHGILVKGSNFIEKLSNLDTVAFDKTGTITKGVFEIRGINSLIDENEFIKYAVYAEYYSKHPIATSIKEAYKLDADTDKISDYKEISGMGVSVTVDGHKILAGNADLLTKNGIIFDKENNNSGTVVYISLDGQFIGHVIISDEIRHDSKKTISFLKKSGIHTVMLTGDRKKSADFIAAQIGLEKVYSQLLPQEKVEKIENIISKSSDGKYIAYVGDGINDAPVLMRSDVGIAMGGIGSDSAIEAADVVIMNDEPSKIISAIRLSSKTMSIVYQNIIFAIGIKILIMILSVLGIGNMWLAIFADVGVSLVAILNSLRALYYKF